MNDELAVRLRDAGIALLGLRGALVAGEPWPLSAAYGTEPEADWGPREVLAHVNEMLGYWPAQLRTVLAGDPAGSPVGFGRTADDPNRLARIEADRQRPAGDLLDGIDAGLVDADAFVAELTPEDLDRLGAHPTRGEITVGASIEAFLASHLEGHVAQLREILARPTSA
jgi:hypothetical protein